MITAKDIRAKTEELRETYTTFLIKAVEAESPSHDKARVDRCAALFIEEANRFGWRVETEHMPNSGDPVCITMNEDAPGQPIALSGHIDTVHPVGLFGSPAVRIENGILYGPGVCDCKGGVVAALYAMAVLDALGWHERPVKLLLQTDEEVGSALSELATVNFLCEKSKECAAFFNLESYVAGTAVLLRKGIERFVLDVFGKSAHASRKWCGASAICEAAHKIIRIEEMNDRDGITCSCGIVSGGTAANTVPDTCKIVIDMRFSDDTQRKTGEEMLGAITETCTVAGTHATLTTTSRRIAMEPSEKNTALLDKINGIYKANGLPSLAVRKSPGGSDAAYITAYGTPCVDNLGIEGGCIHSPEEFARLDALPEAALRLVFPILFM